jgi:hypothetical protein
VPRAAAARGVAQLVRELMGARGAPASGARNAAVGVLVSGRGRIERVDDFAGRLRRRREWRVEGWHRTVEGLDSRREVGLFCILALAMGDDRQELEMPRGRLGERTHVIQSSWPNFSNFFPSCNP